MHLNNFLKRNFSINKKSKAQHVVELAMMMPLFIILFSYTFQLMVETYSKYRFSYIFTNSVRNVINNPVLYNDVANISDYNVQNLIQTELENEITRSGSRIPFTDVLVYVAESDETDFIRGAYQLVTDKIFFGQTGKEYFYFTIPVNKTYTTPIVLNKTTHDVESYFNFYFKYYSEKYYEAESDAAEGGETTDGSETETGEATEGGETEGGETTDGGETEGGDGGGAEEGMSASLEDGSGAESGGGGSDGGGAGGAGGQGV